MNIYCWTNKYIFRGQSWRGVSNCWLYVTLFELHVDVMPWPLSKLRTVTKNGFRDRWLTPVNQHNLFRHASFSLTRRLGNFLGGHLSQDYSTVTPQLVRLTMEYLRIGYWKRRCTFGDISSHFNPFKPCSRCYIYPHLKPHNVPIVPP